jgi:anti-sigma B factor antagonist
MTEPQPEQPNAFGELSVSSRRAGDADVIAVTGELDIGTVEDVERALAQAESGDAARIVLDLSGLTFMDSTGVRLVLAAHARSRADSNRLRLIRGGPSVQRVFELSGIADTLPFVD